MWKATFSTTIIQMALLAVPAVAARAQERPAATWDLLRDASLTTLTPSQAVKDAIFPLATVEQAQFQCGARFSNDVDLGNPSQPAVFYLRDSTVNDSLVSKQPGYLRIDCRCAAPGECPPTGNECITPACPAGLCATNFVGSGTPTPTQVPGDCRQLQCNGAGGTNNAVDDFDYPVDGNDCTQDLCSAGTPSNPPAAIGTGCNQSGGSACDGAGNCISPPTVVSTSPVDGSTPVAAPTISVTFSQAMNAATLSQQTTAGACSGSIQVSLDNFNSCIAFSSPSPVMSGGNTVATWTAAPGPLVNRTYKIRVTTAAQAVTGLPLATPFTQATGFTTASPNLCDGSVVISQLYGGGGNAGAAYVNDYIELHNRGSVTASLTGWSLQYAATTGTTWTVNLLSGSIPPGRYFLVRLASSGATGAPLPTPDLVISLGAINMNANAGKIALMRTTVATPNGNSCPTAANVVDFIGYGTGTNCFEGTGPAPTLSATLAGFRGQSGCADLNLNNVDITVGLPAPRNGASPALVCGCIARNEAGQSAEADYCVVQFPQSLVVQTGTSSGSIFGQLFEAGATEPAGPPAGVGAQLGYGIPVSNPEYQAGWQWFNAAYNVQSGNNDEFAASFTAPAAGDYRYVYRFSLDGGVSWTYCDGNSGDFGAGANPGLTFDLERQPVMTVTP